MTLTPPLLEGTADGAQGDRAGDTIAAVIERAHRAQRDHDRRSHVQLQLDDQPTEGEPTA